MRRRVIVIVFAAVIAALGTALLVGAAGRQHDEQLAEVRATSVLVATDRIEPGTTSTAAEGSVAQAEIPQSALVPGVLTDLGEVAGLQALGPILPGQQIVSGQWGSSPSSPLRPPPGTLGLAIQLGDPQRVAGFVAPGSRVAVLATVASTSATGGSVTRILLPAVTVLGVGGSTLTTRTTQESGETSTEQVPSAVLTLALTPAQAERVVFAVTEGQIYLGLLGEKVRGETGSGVTATNLFEVSP